MNSRHPAPDTLDILKTLIGFESVCLTPNIDLIHWVRDYLAGLGVSSTITTGDDASKANIFATLGGGEGGIVLSGHTDVVSVKNQAWTTDPFEATLSDGRLYGRGACDMKGFIAVVLAKVPLLLASRRKEPVHLAFSFDEEVGCLGIRHLLEDLKARNLKPRGCIIGEPSSMKVVVGHKAGSVFTCEVTGRETHSSLAPNGVNAVEYSARLVVEIRNIAKRLEQEEKRHDGYEVPFTTVQTGVIEGGQASNIVPGVCNFRFDIRSLPWTDPETIVNEINEFAQTVLVPEMREVAPEADIRIAQKGMVPGFTIAEDDPLTRFVKRLVGTNEPARYVTFGSEAGHFQNADIPAVICGPGSIEQAHRPDEFVSLEQLALCEDFLDRLAQEDFPTAH